MSGRTGKEDDHLSDVLGWIDADASGRWPCEVATEWDHLADRVGAPPWLRPQWTTSWWRAFGSGQLTLVYSRRGDRLVGFVPLVHRGRALVAPTNYHSPGYAFVALDQPAAADLADAMISRRRRTVISFVDSEDPTVESLVAAARRRRHLSVTRPLEHPPNVSTTGDWAEYESSRDSRMMRNLRRRERRLAEVGTPSFSIEAGQSHLADRLEECFETEASSWKGAAGTAINSQDATRTFYTEIARFAASRGELMLAFLRLDGRAIATQLNLRSAGTVTVLKLGHDERYSRFAPGKLLVRHVLRDCFADSTTCFDFSGDANAYKLEWTDRTRHLVETRIYPPGPNGAAAWVTRRYGRPLAKRLLRRGNS